MASSRADRVKNPQPWGARELAIEAVSSLPGRAKTFAGTCALTSYTAMAVSISAATRQTPREARARTGDFSGAGSVTARSVAVVGGSRVGADMVTQRRGLQ